MSQDNPVLFYMKEPRYGCTQPVRMGDLLIINNPELPVHSKPFMVMSIISHEMHSGFWSGIFVKGFCEGHIFELHESELALLGFK